MLPHDRLTQKAMILLLKQVSFDCIGETLAMALHGLHVSDVSGYLTISAKALCRNITWESIPDSAFHFYFSSRQGESLGTRLIWSRKINNKKLAGIDLAKSLTLFKSDGVDPESAMNGYFSTSILATSLQN